MSQLLMLINYRFNEKCALNLVHFKFNNQSDLNYQNIKKHIFFLHLAKTDDHTI